MTEKLFPQVPSTLELKILSFVEYCCVCRIHDNKPHPIKLCIYCDKHICYLYDNNIWTIKNGKEICCECMKKTLKENKNITFTFAKKFKCLSIVE